MNENLSLRIESAGNKTCDNRSLINRSAVLNCSVVCWSLNRLLLREQSCFQNNMAASLFVSPHKNKGIFLETR